MNLAIKFWILQHPDNPIWKLRDTVTAMERREAFGVAANTFYTWIQSANKTPRKFEMGKVIKALQTKFSISISYFEFRDSDTKEFWKKFSNDTTLLDQILAEYFIFRHQTPIHKLEYDLKSEATALERALKGEWEIFINPEQFHAKVTYFRVVEALSKSKYYLYVKLELHRENNPPFIYDGVCGQILNTGPIYWIFSSIDAHRSQDMVFVVSEDTGFENKDSLQAVYATISVRDQNMPVAFDITMKRNVSA